MSLYLRALLYGVYIRASDLFGHSHIGCSLDPKGPKYPNMEAVLGTAIMVWDVYVYVLHISGLPGPLEGWSTMKL